MFLVLVYLSFINRKPDTSTSQATKSTTTANKLKTEKACLPKTHKQQIRCPKKSSVLSSGAKKTAGKLTKEKTGTKVSANVTKAKALILKAKDVSAEQKAKVDKPASVKPAKHTEPDTKRNVLPSSEEMTPKTPAGSLSSEGGTKDIKVPSNSTATVTYPDRELSKSKESEKKAQVCMAVPEATKDVVEAENETTPESMQLVECAKDDDEAKGGQKAEPMDIGKTNNEIEVETMDIETSAEDKVESLTNTEALTPKCSESPLSASTTEIKPDVYQPKSSTADTNPQMPQAAIKASLQVQQTTLPEPQSTAQGLKAKTNGSQTPALNSPEAALETELTVEEEETTVQKGMSETISIFFFNLGELV